MFHLGFQGLIEDIYKKLHIIRLIVVMGHFVKRHFGKKSRQFGNFCRNQFSSAKCSFAQLSLNQRRLN